MSKDSNIECEKIDKNPLNFWRYRIILYKFLLFPLFSPEGCKAAGICGKRWEARGEW